MIGLPTMRVLPRQKAAAVAIPVPVGVNLVDPAGSLPAGDCLRMVNLFRSESGSQVRSGYQEWVTGLGAEVRWIFGYEGSIPANDRLFATTSSGIWDCTSSTSSPSLDYTFGTSSSTSGHGIAQGFTNSAGHFLVYTDEENGYVYRDEAGTWTQPVLTGVDSGDLVFATVWKKRIWFVKRDSAIAYYLPTESVTGTVNPIYFGPQFRHGGHLVGLWSWTVDGGVGIDDYLVGISSSGDVVVFQGTDPASAETFGIKAVWYAGAVPAGRHIATTHGGDLIILSALGAFPLSKLLSGASIQAPDLYATRKIGTAITAIMSERRTDLGWSTQIHPEDSTLIINTPQVSGLPREQWVLSFNAGGWTQFKGLPMTCSESYGGKLYFGTADGRVCVNTGPVDNNKLTGSQDAIAIESSMLLGFISLGTAARKRLLMARPHFITDGTAPQYVMEGRANYDFTEISTVAYTDPAQTALWDVGIWDVSEWGATQGVAGEWRGISGYGSQVSLAMKMSTKGAATLVGLDVMADMGGIL